MAPILKLAVVASTASALAPASTPLVSRKLALQEFGIAAAGVLGGCFLGGCFGDVFGDGCRALGGGWGFDGGRVLADGEAEIGGIER